MTPEEQDADRMDKLARCATAAQVRDLITGMAYCAELGVRPYTATQKAAAVKRLSEIEHKTGARPVRYPPC